ncbi:DUF4296 domain-containing protein [Hymenobacter canadensis]|uniref:DUF4296 domain-containing protein n=1 Tax=Hymenobacter canadensis TaxID=2999067 RepID=A0ABY7LVS5_9BACT|nr:DUF4296 domain-containing protein [Hymenobacter canadensis]WBA43621.1 DUF4296 domain-containing protein [Hymenobacter canadensis]
MKLLHPRAFLLVVSVLLSGLMAGCQTPEEVLPPQPLLPREQLVSLLADLHTLEARVETAGLNPDSARALYLQQQKALFWRREVTDSLFQQSYRYYASHDKDLDEIYGLVIDTLALRQVKIGPAK